MFPVSSRSCFVQYIEARCKVENEDVVGAAPTGDAPTTPEWSTIPLPNKMRLFWRYESTKYAPVSYANETPVRLSLKNHVFKTFTWKSFYVPQQYWSLNSHTVTNVVAIHKCADWN